MRQTMGPQALAEPILTKLGLAMSAEGWVTAISAIEEAVAEAPERAQSSRGPCGSGAPQNARHAVRLAIRARISGRIDQNSAVRTAPAMRRLFDPTRDNVIVEAFAMVRSCQDTSWRWILRKRPARPGSCPMGRSLNTRRAANTVRAIQVGRAENDVPGRCGAYRGRSWTTCFGRHCSSRGQLKGQVAFHSAF